MKSKSIIPSLAALTILSSSSLYAAILVSDSFDDGNRSNGSDLLDTQWYANNANSTISVSSAAASSVFSGNNSLFVNNGNQGFIGAVGILPSTTLGAIGSGTEGIRFTFDFRLVNTSANTNGFRFGIFNSLGTQFNGDGSIASNGFNDQGFLARVATGSGTNTMNIGIDRPSPGSGSGTFGNDSTLASDTNSISLNNTSQIYSGYYEVIRDSATTVSVTGSVFTGSGSTGTPLGSASIASYTPENADYFTFDYFGVGSGGVNNLDYTIDNIVVQTVPEPSSSALLLCAFGSVALRRRR